MRRSFRGYGESVRLDAPASAPVDYSQLRFNTFAPSAVVQQVPTTAGMLPVVSSQPTQPAGFIGTVYQPPSASAKLNAPPTGSSGSGYATGYPTGYQTDASGNVIPYPAGTTPAAAGGSLLSGIPMWAIVAAAGVAALLILKK